MGFYQKLQIIDFLLIFSRIVPIDVEKFFVSLIEQAAEYREKNPDKVPDNDYLHHLLGLLQKHEGNFSLRFLTNQSFSRFSFFWFDSP